MLGEGEGGSESLPSSEEGALEICLDFILFLLDLETLDLPPIEVSESEVTVGCMS